MKIGLIFFAVIPWLYIGYNYLGRYLKRRKRIKEFDKLVYTALETIQDTFNWYNELRNVLEDAAYFYYRRYQKNLKSTNFE